MASETDPLLPKGNTAPEISGPGFSSKSARASRGADQSHTFKSHGNVSDESSKASTRGTSPLTTIITLFVTVVAFGGIISLLVPGDSRIPSKGRDSPPTHHGIDVRVGKILSETPLIDGHNDLAALIRYMYQNKLYSDKFTSHFQDGQLAGHVDLPRLKAGKVGGSFWSAWTPCPEDGLDFSDGNYAETVAMTFSQVDLIRRLTAAYPSKFLSPHLNSSQALSGFQKNGTLISPIGVEGLHQIGNAVSNLRLLHSLGVKYVTLTHNCHNAFADAALVSRSGTLVASTPYWGGLSPRGVLVIQEMNRLGMLVDISHVSKDTMVDVLGGNSAKTAGSASAVMFSHSSAFTLCPHPRNVADDVLELVKKTRSIVMVNFSPDFISCIPSDSSTGIPDFYAANSTLHQVARHVVHIGQKIGYDHVGLGSDFDGIFEVPEGLEDVSKFPDLIAELLHMGVSDGDVAKLVGLNVLRVWEEAEKTGQRMRAEGVLPLEDDVESRDDSFSAV